jgi:hypothetical protein
VGGKSRREACSEIFLALVKSSGRSSSDWEPITCTPTIHFPFQNWFETVFYSDRAIFLQFLNAIRSAQLVSSREMVAYRRNTQIISALSYVQHHMNSNICKEKSLLYVLCRLHMYQGYL